MDRIVRVALGIAVTMALAPSAGAIAWEWNTAGNTEGWTAGNAISSLAASGGDLVATYDGAVDPYIWSPTGIGLDASQATVLVTSIEIIDPSVGATPQLLQVFYRRLGFPHDDWGLHSFVLAVMPNVGKKTYTVNIPDRLATQAQPADWSGTIDQLRLDPGNGPYTVGATCRIDYMQVVPLALEEDPSFVVDMNETEGTFKHPFTTRNFFNPGDVPADLTDDDPFIDTFCFFNAFGADPMQPEFEIYDEDATPVYQFHKLTDKIDTILAAGLMPYLTLGNCPVDMARDPGSYSTSDYGRMTCGPADYDLYRTFVKDLFDFMDDKYGEETVASWLYRFMTEPDNPGWWTDSREEWFKFYDYTLSGAWEANPGVRISPGNLVRKPGEDPLSWVVPLAEFLDSGAFSVPGESRPYLPPNLNFSVYSPGFINGGGGPQTLNSDVSIRDALDHFPSFNNIPLCIDEGYILADENHQVIWSRIDGTEWGAAHFAFLCETLMNDGWTRSNLWWAGDPECPPPMRNVLNLIHAMNGMTKIAIPAPSRNTSSGGYASTLAAEGDNLVTVMLTNYHHNRTAVAPADCEVVIKNLPPGRYRVSHKRIDHNHGNYRTQWLADFAGFDHAGISEYDLDPFNFQWWGDEADELWRDKYPTYQALASNMDMSTRGYNVDESGELRLTIQMPAHSVSFLYIENPDFDEDGLTNDQETMDLDPDTPGIQNPFNPDDADSTGDDGAVGPDGVLDGQNDWDGDGMTNAEEFAWGFNPSEPESYGTLPAGWAAGALVMLGLGAVMLRKRMKRRA